MMAGGSGDEVAPLLTKSRCSARRTPGTYRAHGSPPSPPMRWRGTCSHCYNTAVCDLTRRCAEAAACPVSLLRSSFPTSSLLMSTLETVQKLLAEKFELKPEQLNPSSELDRLGLDSLSIIAFMFKVEDEFKVKLPDERVEIKTVQDIVAIVDKLIAEQHGETA